MSYKKDLQVTATTEYDFVDIYGPSTYKEIDTLFTEYCKEASTFATEEAVSHRPDERPKTSSFNPAKSQRANKDSPLGKKSSLASIVSADRKAYHDSSMNNVRTVKISETPTYRSEEPKAVVNPRHVKIDSIATNSTGADITQLAKEFEVPLAALATLNTQAEKERYVIECIRKHFNEEFKEFSKKHAAKLHQSKKFEKDFQKMKDTAKGNKADIFKWLQVRTPFEPLKKKLRARIIETIHEVQNNEVKPRDDKSVRLDKSLDERSRNKDVTNLNNTKMITLDHIPAINNSELLGGILEDEPSTALKITKRMKSARNKETLVSARLNSSQMQLNSSMLSTRVNTASAGLTTRQPLSQKAAITEGDKQNEEAENYSWDPRREHIFSYHRADAKSRLFNAEDVRSPSWNELGFSPLIQAFMMIEKSKSERDAKLAQYMNGDLLTAEEYKFLANTSTSLNSCVDKKFLQKVVNNIDPEVIEALELDLAENILKEYQKVRKEIKEARHEYLKEDTKRGIEKADKNNEKHHNNIRLQINRYEQKKTKKKIVNYLNKLDEKKDWKKPKTHTHHCTEEKVNPIVKLFSDKLLNAVGHVETQPRTPNLNFLRAFAPTSNLEREAEVKLSQHQYHPSSKIVLNTDPQQQKDFLGLGTSYTNQKLKRVTNENIEDYKLNIHSSPEFRNKNTFRNYYSGGPTGDDQTVFQGNFLFGDVSEYKVTPHQLRIIVKFQAAWRGYKQRKNYKDFLAKARERERHQKKLAALKQNPQSNFIRVMLKAKETKGAKVVSINPKIMINKQENGAKNSQNLKSDRSLALSKSSTLLDIDKRYLSIHDSQQPLPSLRENPGAHNGQQNNLEILITEDGNLKSGNKPSITPIIKKVTAFTSQEKKNININITESMQEVDFSAIHPRTTEAANLSHRSYRKGATETLSTIMAEESPNRKRIRTIVTRAPPKGLLLKQRKLFVAAKTNNLNMILISGFNYFETDVNAKDDQNNTPLFYAAKNGNKEICEFLLGNGARVNEQCSEGNTPLHMGFYSNQVMLVIVLISHGGNLNILNDHGQTPIAFGSESLLKLLNLKDAVATYEKNDAGKTLPQGHDNNQYMVKLNNKKPPQDAMSFKYQPLAKSSAKVADEEHNLYSFLPPKERVKSAVRRHN